MIDLASKHAADEVKALFHRILERDRRAIPRDLILQWLDELEKKIRSDTAKAELPAPACRWTPELEKARVDLCEFWAGLADDWPGANEVTRRAVETEQALTILGDIARGEPT